MPNGLSSISIVQHPRQLAIIAATVESHVSIDYFCTVVVVAFVVVVLSALPHVEFGNRQQQKQRRRQQQGLYGTLLGSKKSENHSC